MITVNLLAEGVLRLERRVCLSQLRGKVLTKSQYKLPRSFETSNFLADDPVIH